MKFAKKCASAIFAMVLIFTSCSLNSPTGESSKIYLITVSNDYYGIKETLSDCINDGYGILGQFTELAGEGNIESLSFITQLGNSYVMKGFDREKYAKYGTKITSYESDDVKKGLWKVFEKDSTSGEIFAVEFRIGKPGLTTQEEWQNSANWGAELVSLNSEIDVAGSVAGIVYNDNYEIYICKHAEESETYNYKKVASVPAFSNYPFRFEYDSKKYVDNSGYTDKNSSSLKYLYNLYDEKYLYKLADTDDYRKFTIWKLEGQVPTKWTWSKPKTPSTANCVYAYDEIKEWLSSKILSADDVIIFYYSGHGVNRVTANPNTGDNDLVTESDGALVMPSERNNHSVNVNPEDVLDLFSTYDCHKFFIIDSCYSGNFINYTGNELYDCDEYSLAYTQAYSAGGGRDVYDFYLGSSNIFRCLMGGVSDTEISKYKNTWIITGSTFLNPSLSGVDIYGGTSIRYGAMTSCILNRLGYDIKRSEITSDKKGSRVTVYDIMDGVLSDFPMLYRAYYEFDENGKKAYKLNYSQNPQVKRSLVDLILF